jgi:hypothetical protein
LDDAHGRARNAGFAEVPVELPTDHRIATTELQDAAVATLPELETLVRRVAEQCLEVGVLRERDPFALTALDEAAQMVHLPIVRASPQPRRDAASGPPPTTTPLGKWTERTRSPSCRLLSWTRPDSDFAAIALD